LGALLFLDQLVGLVIGAFDFGEVRVGDSCGHGAAPWMRDVLARRNETATAAWADRGSRACEAGSRPSGVACVQLPCGRSGDAYLCSLSKLSRWCQRTGGP